MKKILISRFPIILASLTLLIVASFVRYNLYINSNQLTKEFLNQNSNELYSMDTLKLSSRLNSFSRALNWVCIEGEVNSQVFFSMKKAKCGSNLFQQHVEIKIPEANNSKISFTLKASEDLEILFSIFLFLQTALIVTLVFVTKKAEEEKMKNEIEISKLSRKMFHDIRSPLASLSAIASSASFSNKNELDIFQTSILRINDTANVLLNKTRSNMIVLPSFVKIEALVNETIEEKKKEYSNLNINIVGLNNLRATVFLVPSEIKNILSNLINNSIEACPGVPKINITSLIKNDQLEIIISDNGNGIPFKILKQLGSSEVTTKLNGNGIGLKDAIESMLEWGGNLEILESSSNGTKIKLTFVIKREDELFILIDDDILTRMTWETKAKKASVQLKTFATPDEFNSLKGSFPKDTVIYIDSELGEIKGEDLAHELHIEGFLNISLATGHPPENFNEFKFLKSIISKSAPF